VEFKASEVKQAKVTIAGQDYFVNLPKVKDRHALRSLLKDVAPEQAEQAMLDWLVSRGLPAEAIGELYESELLELTQMIIAGPKKK
jgi:hypothetical protein